MTGCRLHLIEFGHAGHHGAHLRELALGWRAASPPGAALRITVSPHLVAQQGEVIQVIHDCARFGVELDILSVEEQQRIDACPRVESVPAWWVLGVGPPPGSLARTLWDIGMERARAARASQLAFLAIDLVLPALAAHLPAASKVSGVWLQPALHYGSADQRPEWILHQKVLIARSLAHPKFHRLFTHDPYVGDQVASHEGRTVFRHLPHRMQPVTPLGAAARARLRYNLGIPQRASAHLFFGRLSRRKGFFQLSSGAQRLSVGHRDRLFLIVAGQRDDDIDRREFYAQICYLREAGIHVLVRDEFISERDSEDLFEACDVVLAPYTRHIGISDVVARAAAHGRPVLAQDYGLIGKLVRKHSLGLAVDTRDPAEIAAAMASLIDGNLASNFQPSRAFAFAAGELEQGLAKSFFAGLDLDQAE